MSSARHHAHQHSLTRNREQRKRLAQEAARLMAESGTRDYHLAKRKAAAALGVHDDASLPRNDEIQEALRSYQRLFQPEQQAHALRTRRDAALRAMEFFAAFDPRLVGPVLDGTADANTPVSLHLHADDANAVVHFLDEQRIPAEHRTRRLRLDRNRSADFETWLFSAEDLVFELMVLPIEALRQAPLSNVDEKPMRRASISQLRELMTAGQGL